MTMPHDLLILADADAVADAAIELVVASANAAVEADGRFVLALSGGPTVDHVHRRLARPDHAARIPWDRTWVVFTDERCVGPDAADANFERARETLLDRVPIDRDRVLRIDGDIPQASRAAHFYEEALRELFPDRDLPAIDLALVGMGEDGRTAALFPGSDALEVDDRWATAVFLPDRGEWRVTLTLPALRAAHQVVVVVTGSAKAGCVGEAFGEGGNGADLPVRRLVPTEGARVVLADEDAAAGLGEPT